MEVNTGEVLEVAMKISAEEQTEGATKKVSIGERTEGATKKGTTGERIMKKVSTGERIKLEDLRRRSVGGQRNADIDVTSEQRFVSELMDTTPSSSYEEPSRDLTSNLDASVSDSPLPKYDSDVEAADEVVTGTQDTVTKIDLIVKEDVPEIPGETQQGSLLAAELAAVKFSGSQPSQTVSARQRDDTLSDGESLMGDPRVDHGADHGRGGGGGGCTAEQLIRALVSECQTLELSSDLRQTSDKYVLRMADDDWDPDLDFPGLDSSAVITDVGVDQFVLCHQAKNEPMLHVTIALHEGLNGSLTGTGAVEAPSARATMTLEVNFRIPGQDNTHHMSVRIAPDSSENDLLHSRDSESRNGAVNAVCESEEIVRTESDGKENLGGQDGHGGHGGQEGHGGKVEEVSSEENRPVSEAAEEEETLKLRNIDTGEDIELGEIDERVPPSLDPGELFRSKDVS